VADDQSDRVSVPTLVMTGGPLDGTAYPLPADGGETILGSSMDAGVQIMLGNVEPFHARILSGPGGLAIEDAGSATGTFVNGEKVEGRHPLQDGDRICLGPPGAKGSAKLLVRLPAASAASPGGPLQAPVAEDAPILSFAPEDGPETPQEFDLQSEAVLDAQAVVVDDSVAGPPLDVAEVGPVEDEGDALFATPLPPALPHEASPGRPRRPRLRPSPPPAPPPPRPAPPGRVAPPPPAPPPPATAAGRGRSPDRAPSAPRAGRVPGGRVPDRPALDPVRARAGARGPRRPRSHRCARSPAGGPAGGREGEGPRAGAPARSFSLPSIPVVPVLGGGAGPSPRSRGSCGSSSCGGPRPRWSRRSPRRRSRPDRPVTLAGRRLRRRGRPATRSSSARPGAQVTRAEAGAARGRGARGRQGKVPLVVQTKEGRSKPVSVTVLATAKATALEPDVALPGQVVLVRGEGFEGQKLAAQVGGVQATAVEATAEGAR
jgi:hypothetical protein